MTIGEKRHIKKLKRARILAARIKHHGDTSAFQFKRPGRDITSEVVKIIKPSLIKRLWVALKAFVKFGFRPYKTIKY